MRTGRGISAIVIAAGALLAGCAAPDQRPPNPTPEPIGSGTDQTGPADLPPTGERAERVPFVPPTAELPPALPDAPAALEAVSWAVPRESETIARALASLALPTPSQLTGVTEELRSAGLRLVRLRATDAGALFELAPPTSAVRRRVVLPGALFEEIVRGRALESPAALQSPAGRRLIGPGTPQLEARAWIVPDDLGNAALRVELALTVEAPQRPGRTTRLVRSGDELRPLRGTLVPGVSYALPMRSGEVWALFADAPDHDWDDLIAPALSPAATADQFDPALQQAQGAAGIGPALTPLATAGETLLAIPHSELLVGAPRSDETRLIVLLVPRVPDRYTLFAD